MQGDKQKNSLKDNPMHSINTTDLENVKILTDLKYKSFFFKAKENKQEAQILQWKRLRNKLLRVVRGIGGGEKKQHTFHMYIYGTEYVGCLLRFPFLFIFYLTLSPFLRINHTVFHTLLTTPPLCMVFPVESDYGQKEVFVLFLPGAGTPGFSKLMYLAGPSGKSE